ncbi:class I mannose-6-phosphate isomerase [Porphyromonadaceae bacterium W3.11]|nr:class I mannose-6-phosphate isomerase [Porphyromonadaceae bacterium W3.11]
MNSLPELYPLRFHAAFERKIWGGNRIFKYKELPSPYPDIGETMEISPLPGYESTVSTGELAGMKLTEVVAAYGKKLLGTHVLENYGGEFPLLVKLIDAHETLSVQVHPSDDHAEKHHKKGKCESWYILGNTEDAKIYAGWAEAIDPDELPERCKDDRIMNCLKAYSPKEGDLFYLPAGTIHTIGAGCLLMEIQQASDLTYRIYDFNRKGSDGKCRDLHLQEAIEVLNYSTEDIPYVPSDREVKEQRKTLLETPYFNIGVLSFSSQYLYELEERDSFTILFVDQGEVMMEYPHGVEQLRKGDFLLIPASLKTCNLMPISESVKLVDCYVPGC